MVYIIGAGSGDSEYLTVKAARILASADFVLYVPGLYLENILGYCSNKCEKIKIKSFPLAAQIEFIKNNPDKVIVRLHTGDLAFESGYRDFVDCLLSERIPFECVPGISSVSAVASALALDYFLPAVSSAVTVVKASDFPFVLPGQNIGYFAGCGSLVVFGINADTIENVVRELETEGFMDDVVVCLASRVSMPEQKIVFLKLSEVCEKVKTDKSFQRFTVLLFGNFLEAKSVYFRKEKICDFC